MNAKIYNGNVQPNPKEFKIWVNDEGTIKTWNGTKWVENTAGESGSGSGEASTIEYLDVSGMDQTKMSLVTNAYLVKFVSDNKVQISGGFMIGLILDLESMPSAITAVAIDFNAGIVKGGDKIETVLEDLSESFSQEQLDAIPRITKEQFYNLEA